MLLQSIHLTNFLSFGPESEALELRNLNVIIGPNGSGKSNFIEALAVIHGTSQHEKSLLNAISNNGGSVRDWLWKSSAPGTPTASIDVVLPHPNPTQDAGLRYVLGFTESGQRFQIADERIEKSEPDIGHSQPYFYYHFKHGRGILNIKGDQRKLQSEEIDPVSSILLQRKDPDQYPELTHLGNIFSKIRIYREWSFGRNTPARIPQNTNSTNDNLEPDASNLSLVLNKLRGTPSLKKKLLKALNALYEGIDDFDVRIEGGTVQTVFVEGDRLIPATRLSDGTLRYLCLLTILLNPNQGSLVCIEEPELGLHPDVLPTLADLIKEASEHTQLIVTTHSDVLIDALSDTPESVLVAERDENGTVLKRLDAEQLKPWLENYRLGQLWTDGQIGGTRW